MSNWTRLATAVCIAVLLSACGPSDSQATRSGAPAQVSEERNYRDFGEYVVHYNAISTDELSPDIARAYRITRSPNRAMLNVSILRKNPDAPGTPVTSKVTARVVNLTGQLKSVELREIREAEAVYYIGELKVANTETLIFDISATPDGTQNPLTVRYQKQFYSR